MSLNPSNISYNWNYNKPNNPGFSLDFIGTVVSMQEVQARDFNYNSNQPGPPAFWPDGNPKMNIRIGFATPDGLLKSVTFNKAGKKQQLGEKPSLHMQLFAIANGNMNNLMGKTVCLCTWNEHPGFNELLGFKIMPDGTKKPNDWNDDKFKGVPWGKGNPRLFGVQEMPDVKYELAMPLPDQFKVPQLYANDGAAGGKPAVSVPQQTPQQMHQQMPQQANVMPMAGQFYTAPSIAGYQQPIYQPAPQQFQPPQSAPMPQGMDPAVMAAMQTMGAVNVQPAADPYSVYDDDIPFS